MALALPVRAAEERPVFLPLIAGPGAAGPPPPPLPAPGAVGARLIPGPIPFPDGVATSVKQYGAKGDGVTDDTAAIQRALDDGRRDAQGRPLHDDFFGRPKTLFFPAGVYLVSATLDWEGCCMTLQGQGSGATVIRLRPSAAGFGDPAAPRPVLATIDGNMSFRQNIWDLGISVGPGNPGAVGLDWISSNWGSIRNLAIIAEDGRGARGLDMTRQWPGPSLASNLLVRGFDVGVDIAHAEYGPVFEHLTLEGQRVAGIRNDGNTLAVRSLKSTNSVPAIRTAKPWSSTILLDAELGGGAAGSPAIDLAEGLLYARGVTAAGYQSALRRGGAPVAGMALDEYVSGEVKSLLSTSPPRRSLGLPIAETPSFHEPNLARWARFTTANYGDTSRLQGLLSSGATTVYFPAGAYLSFNEREVTVPPGVRRIVGFGSVINGDSRGTNGGGIRFVVAEPSAEPLIIEGFGYGVKVDHRAARPVALKSGGYEYVSAAGAGDLYLDDVGVEPLLVKVGQRVWARQLNNEYGGTKIRNEGGELWIVGLKTERGGTVIETVAGGKTELLGTLIYPSRAFPRTDVAFISRDSQMSLIYSESVYCQDCGYATHIEETRGAETRRMTSQEVGRRMALFVGF